jgi:DNA recombination protein Rad52
MNNQIFSQDQITLLESPLITSNIKTRDGGGNTKLSFITGHHAISECNRIFGFGNWQTEIQNLKQVDRTEYSKKGYGQNDPPKKMVAIAYICQLKLTVSGEGQSASHEEVGFGNGSGADTAHGIGSSIELATKEAVTDALKRCLRYYGNQFGLTLYDKDGHGAMTDEQAYKQSSATEDQFKELDRLLAERDVDREWLMTAMRAEKFGYKSLDEMTQEWYQIAYKIVYEYKLKEMVAIIYSDEIQKRLVLISEVPNIQSLTLVFKEAWTMAKDQNDDKMVKKIVDAYEKMKAKFGVKK